MVSFLISPLNRLWGTSGETGFAPAPPMISGLWVRALKGWGRLSISFPST
jgi:hypothetical protein